MLPKEYEWIIQYAEREKKKWRAKGGMLSGIRKNMEMNGVRKETKDTISYKIRINEKDWRIISL